MKNDFLEKCIDSVKNLTTENEEQEIAKRVVINTLIDTMEKYDELSSVIEEAMAYINETYWYEDMAEEEEVYFKESFGVDGLLDILDKYKNK